MAGQIIFGKVEGGVWRQNFGRLRGSAGLMALRIITFPGTASIYLFVFIISSIPKVICIVQCMVSCQQFSRIPPPYERVKQTPGTEESIPRRGPSIHPSHTYPVLHIIPILSLMPRFPSL